MINQAVNMTRTLSVLALLALAATLAACDWTTHADTTLPDYRHRVDVVPVAWQSSYPVIREFAGEVVAPQNPVVAFELPGQVRELLVDEGDRVEAGALLARLDTQLLVSEAEELAARDEEIRAELDLGRRNLARIERLESERLASERERDELASRVRSLEASLARNQAALDANRIRQEKSELRAPFAARIGARVIDAGAVVAAGTPVFRLVQTDVREVRAGLPTGIARNLAPGDRLTLRSGTEQADGTVAAVGIVVDQGTRSQAVRVVVDRDWSPGEIAYLEVEEAVPVEGAWLPDTAVTGGLRGTWLVYVAVPGGDREAVLEARTVTIHHASAGRLFVSGALRDGELVVAGGLHRVAPGQAVRTSDQERLSDARPIP